MMIIIKLVMIKYGAQTNVRTTHIFQKKKKEHWLQKIFRHVKFSRSFRFSASFRCELRENITEVNLWRKDEKYFIIYGVPLKNVSAPNLTSRTVYDNTVCRWLWPKRQSKWSRSAIRSWTCANAPARSIIALEDCQKLQFLWNRFFAMMTNLTLLNIQRSCSFRQSSRASKLHLRLPREHSLWPIVSLNGQMCTKYEMG